MATSTFNAPADSNVTADFRSWGSGLNAALAAVGLIQTGDTGQVNWTTVTAPTVGNTAQGYEIWRLNDALQSTSPVFIKIEYGNGNTVANPAIWLSTGTGSNGSGTLLNVSSRWQIGTGASSSTSFACSVAGDAGGVGVVMWGTTTNGSIPFAFFIERSKSTAGADTGAYVAVWWSSGLNGNNTNIGFYVQFLPGGAILNEPNNNTGTATFPGLNTNILNTQASGNIALIPIMPCVGFFNSPMRRAICGRALDWTNGDTPQISIYAGVTDSYIVFRIGSQAGAQCTWCFGPMGPQNPNYCLIMRFQ